MPYARMMQTWVTLNGANVAAVVTQPSSRYFRVGETRDVVAHVEVAALTGSANLHFETGPTKNEDDFVAVDPSATIALAVGVTNLAMAYASVATPLGRYLRWRLTSGTTGAYGATFRIWLSVTS